MRNKHFGTRVFWYCGECRSTRYTTNKSREEARPRQELADGCSKFNKSGRSAKRSDTLNVSNKRKFLPPIIRKSITIYPSTSLNIFEDNSKRIKRPTDVVHPGSSSKCITTGNDSDGVQKMKDSGTVCCSGSKIRDANSQEKDLPVALVINGYGDHAQRAFWKGDFDVFHVLSHVYSGIQAHFSSKVSSKVYDTSKHLPKTLYFTALLRKDVWPKAFLLEPPNKKDIGLYFFPCAAERHKAKFVRLLEQLNLGDYALQTSIDGVELLVFLSNQLPAEHQRLDGETYLWGVFHHLTNESNNCAISDTPFPSVNVSEPIDLDVPPGFSSLITPRVSRCSSSPHQSSSHKTTCEGSMPSRMEIRDHIVGTTLEPHQAQRKFNLQKAHASIDSSSGFLEPDSGASNNVKSSVVNVPLKKVTNLIDDPDTPPGFSGVRFDVPSGRPRSHKNRLKDPRLSRMDSNGQIAATTVGGYKPASTPHEVQPIQKADVSFHTSSGFLEGNSRRSNSVESSIVKEPSKNATHSCDPDATSGSSLRNSGFFKFGPSELASYQHPNSSSPAIPMEPMSPIKKYAAYEHSTTSGGYPHQVQPRFHQVGGPVYQDIRPDFSQFGPPSFPPLPNYSTSPTEVAWSSRLDTRGHLTSTIDGGYAAPASQMQRTYPQMPAGPRHPVFRPESPYFTSYSAGRGHIPYASPASQQNRQQPNYPQGPPTA